jgi:hypothetical protein
MREDLAPRRAALLADLDAMGFNSLRRGI